MPITKRYLIILYYTGWYLFSGILNTLRPRQSGRHFADAIFKCIFFNENICISLKISLKFVPKVSINNIPAFVQIIAWRLPSTKPLSEPMVVILPTYIWVIGINEIICNMMLKLILTWRFVLYAPRMIEIPVTADASISIPLRTDFISLILRKLIQKGHPWQFKHQLCHICTVSSHIRPDDSSCPNFTNLLSTNNWNVYDFVFAFLLWLSWSNHTCTYHGCCLVCRAMRPIVKLQNGPLWPVWRYLSVFKREIWKRCFV